MSSTNFFYKLSVCMSGDNDGEKTTRSNSSEFPTKISTMPQYRCTRSIFKNFEEQSLFAKKIPTLH